MPPPASVRFVALTSGPLNEVDPAPSPTARASPLRCGRCRATPASPTSSSPTAPAARRCDDHAPRRRSLSGVVARRAALAFVAHRRPAPATSCCCPLADRRERTAGRLRQRRRAARQLVGRRRVAGRIVRARARSDPRLADRARLDATGVREELTLPTPGTLGDHSPSVSPDGTRIAFVRGINGATADIHLDPVQRRHADAHDVGQPGPHRPRLERRRPRRSSSPPIAPAATASSACRLDGGDAAAGRRRRGEVEAPVGRARRAARSPTRAGRTRSTCGKRRFAERLDLEGDLTLDACVPSCRPRICGTTRRISRPTDSSSRSSRRDRAAPKCGSPIATASSPRQLIDVSARASMRAAAMVARRQARS